MSNNNNNNQSMLIIQEMNETIDKSNDDTIDNNDDISVNVNSDIIDTSMVKKYGKKICSILFPNRVCFWPHHKTGVDITKQIFMETIFAEFCGVRNAYKRYWIRCVDNRENIEYEPFNIDTNNGYETIHKLSMLNITDNSNVTIFHMTRDPLNTIISGFFYHIQCSEPFMHLRFFNQNRIDMAKEFFELMHENKTINNVTEMRYIYEHLIYTNKYNQQQLKLRNMFWNGKKYGALGTFDMYRWLSMWIIFNITNYQNIDYYGYKEKDSFILNQCEMDYNILRYPHLQNKTGSPFFKVDLLRMIGFHQMLQRIKSKSLLCAIYFEFLRYLFQTYPEQYEIYNLLNIPKDRLKKINHYEIKMENFLNDFAFNTNEILNGLNIIDTFENRMKLKENDFPIDIVNIAMIRQYLSEQIKLHDPRHIRKNKSLKVNRHIHLERNNTLAIQTLLTADNGSICFLLKYITPLIGYEWVYSQYC